MFHRNKRSLRNNRLSGIIRQGLRFRRARALEPKFIKFAKPDTPGETKTPAIGAALRVILVE